MLGQTLYSDLLDRSPVRMSIVRTFFEWRVVKKVEPRMKFIADIIMNAIY